MRFFPPPPLLAGFRVLLGVENEPELPFWKKMQTQRRRRAQHAFRSRRRCLSPFLPGIYYPDRSNGSRKNIASG